MTTETNEIDVLKQELRTAQRLLDDAKGKIKAVELDSYEIKREAKKAVEGAEALKAETDAALATASEQLRVAHAIGCGIYGMAELGRALMARKVTSARCCHREATLGQLLQAFVDAADKNDQTLLKTAKERTTPILASIKADGERNRNEAHEMSLAYGFKDFQETFNKLLAAGNVKYDV